MSVVIHYLFLQTVQNNTHACSHTCTHTYTCKRERERERESEGESERDCQPETRRHAGCAGAPRAGGQIQQQLDQCACKLEGAIGIAPALVAGAQDAATV